MREVERKRAQSVWMRFCACRLCSAGVFHASDERNACTQMRVVPFWD